MTSPAPELPQELLICVFIHGFVLPFPRWVRQAVLQRAPGAPGAQAGTQRAEALPERNPGSHSPSSSARPLPALLPISPLTIVSHFAPPSPIPPPLLLSTTPLSIPGKPTKSTATAKPTTTATTTTTPDPHIPIDIRHPSFKGTDGTFCGFPDRLKHVLHETLPDMRVECVVFPAYETRGELAEATARFVTWLTELTVNLEASHGLRAGGAKIVLCGHSMGGLVAADALLGVAGGAGAGGKGEGEGKWEAPDGSGRGGEGERVFWPRIIACIGYDTPYLGLHPNVFKHSVSQVTSYVDAARAVASGLGIFGLANPGPGAPGSSSARPSSPRGQPSNKLLAPPPSSPSPQSFSAQQSKPSTWASAASSASWSKLASSVSSLSASVSPTYVAAAAGTLLAGAAAGTAYYRRQDLAGGWQWASDHLRYVGNLWDEEGMRGRLEGVVDTGVVFRNFYTLLPASALTPRDRTFSVLPASASPLRPFFRPQRNSLAKDEIDAHIGMFEPRSNDGYYELGLEVVSVVREAVERFRTKSAGAATQVGDGVGEKVRRAEQAEPEAAAAGKRAAHEVDSSPDLIDLTSEVPLSATSASTSTGTYHSSASSLLPPTPSSYPTPSVSAGETPISAVPSSAQFSDLPWSAKSGEVGLGRGQVGKDGGGEGEGTISWADVPVEQVPITPREEPAEGGEDAEGGEGEEGRGVLGGEMEMENPWVGRLRRKDRKR